MALANKYTQLVGCARHSRCFCTKVTVDPGTKPPALRDADRIGPPDPVSNLRPIVFAKSENETNLEKRYRETREATQIWNQQFWSSHNAKFTAERKEFQRAQKEQGKDSLTSDEMSVFYKRFLDDNWYTHLRYNIMWYKRNVQLLILEIRVRLSKMKFK